MRNSLFASSLLILLVCLGCKSYEKSSTEGLEKIISRIEYDFQDSSVPPPYHRSYDIVITKDSITKLVHSYGDTVSYKSKPCTEKDLQSVRLAMNSANIRNCKREDTEGCTGGTGVRIRSYTGDMEAFNGYRYDCGGVKGGTLCGDTDAVLSALNDILRN